MAYASWSVVFGEQPSAAKWNILGTNDSSFNDGTGIANGKILPNHLVTSASTLNTHVWDSWTPTLSGLFNNAKWTKSCKYIQIGKTVFFRLQLTASTTTPMDGAGSALFTLPVTSVTYPGTATTEAIGWARLTDIGVAAYLGSSYWASTTTGNVQVSNASATYLQPGDLTAAVPFAFSTNDEIFVEGFYEAA